MPDKVLASLLPQPSAKQEAFITQYIDKSYKKKKAAKQAMLESAWLTFVSSRDTCSEIVDLVSSVAKSKEDFDFVSNARIKCGQAIAKIKPGTFKGLSDATKQIVEVAEDLVALRKEATAYMRTQSDGGRDLNEEAAIRLIKSEAVSSLVLIDSEFSTKAEELRAQVRKEAPNVSWDPTELAAFRETLNACRNDVSAIPSAGDKADKDMAKTTADKAVAEAGTARDTHLNTMDSYAKGDSFKMFVADKRLQDEIMVALAKVRETLVQLDRWGASDAPKIATDADAIEKEIGHVFTDRSGLSQKQADDAKQAQLALVGKATDLERRAESAVSNTQEAFDSQIDELRPQVERLEARWKICKKNVGKRQSAPIEAQIAAMRLALDGLGGCNTSAIDAIRKMIKESTDLVLEAENIEALNARILSTLTDAAKEAKALTGKANPIADVFEEHGKEIATFKEGFKEKSLTEATKGAQELLEKVRKDAQRNQDLIDRRRAILQRIARREKQLADFNLLFRQMLEQAGETPKDYRGSFKADIETCKSWAATKTDPAFYDTIDAKLTSILSEMEKEAGNLRLLASKSYKDLQLEAMTAATRHRDENLRLNAADATAIRDHAEARLALEDIQQRQAKGETVPESELKAAQEALKAANAERSRIAEDRAVVQKEYDEATFLLDRKTELVAELARAEAADEIAERKKEEFLEKSKGWLSDVKTEVKDKETVLHDYKDEVDPQIDRVETSRKMLKDGKNGITGAAALSELDFVKKFFDQIRKRGKKTDKRQLGDIGDQWDKEVLKINKSASDLITAIEEFEKFPEVEGTASADVEKMFGVILGRMMDHGFEQAAKTFNDSADKQVRKAAREQALSEVRRYRALIFKDPLLQKCVLNPFGVPVGSSTANRLDEIELNVLRGI